jgi:hypothetical protein
MEALGMVYPQYWCVEECRENFEMHMQVIKTHYCNPKSTQQKKGKSKRKSGSAAALAAKQVSNFELNSCFTICLVPPECFL